MPYSPEAMTLDCKQDISVCQNFNQLRNQLIKNLDAKNGATAQEVPPSLVTEGSESKRGGTATGTMLRQTFVNQFENNKLRQKYNPQQIIYNRALKAQTMCQVGNLINQEAVSDLKRIKQTEKEIDSNFKKMGGKGHYVQRLKTKDNKVVKALDMFFAHEVKH
jgi:hypothetical protein